MSNYNYKCPLCGHGFDKSDESCYACPVAKDCNVVCCPNCGYSFAGQSQIVDWFKAKFGSGKNSAGKNIEADKEGEEG